jgi:hypothetical protein
MKKLNQTASLIFCKLLDKLEQTTHCKLISEGYMPLVIEQVNEDVQTPYGKSKLISLAHYYEQNGDAMRDPEMCFIVVDKRDGTSNSELVWIFPQMFQQDSLSLYEESINIDGDRITTYKPTWQAGHTNFANQWLRNIRQQGFLKAIPKHL